MGCLLCQLNWFLVPKGLKYDCIVLSLWIGKSGSGLMMVGIRSQEKEMFARAYSNLGLDTQTTEKKVQRGGQRQNPGKHLYTLTVKWAQGCSPQNTTGFWFCCCSLVFWVVGGLEGWEMGESDIYCWLCTRQSKLVFFFFLICTYFPTTTPWSTYYSYYCQNLKPDQFG